MAVNSIPKLAKVRRWDKAAGNEVVLKDVGDPLGVLFVGFLAPDRFDILWVSQNDVAGRRQNIVNGDPVLLNKLRLAALETPCFILFGALERSGKEWS